MIWRTIGGRGGGEGGAWFAETVGKWAGACAGRRVGWLVGRLGGWQVACPPGLHTTARELQTRTNERPGRFKNTTKIPREDPQDREERKKTVAGEGKKKARNFGPTLRTLHFSGFGKHPSSSHFSRRQECVHFLQGVQRAGIESGDRAIPTLERLWPKPTLARTIFGQIQVCPILRLAMPTLARFGQNQVWPNQVWPNQPFWPN